MNITLDAKVLKAMLLFSKAKKKSICSTIFIRDGYVYATNKQIAIRYALNGSLSSNGEDIMIPIECVRASVNELLNNNHRINDNLNISVKNGKGVISIEETEVTEKVEFSFQTCDVSQVNIKKLFEEANKDREKAVGCYLDADYLAVVSKFIEITGSASRRVEVVTNGNSPTYMKFYTDLHAFEVLIAAIHID